MEINELVVFEIVFFTAFILQILPVFPMSTSSENENVSVIMQVVQGVASVTSNAVHISFAFKDHQILRRSYFGLLYYFHSLFLLNSTNRMMEHYSQSMLYK